METLSAAGLRHAFAAYPTGMVLVAAAVDGRDEAMLVNSFTSVSLDPPLISMAFTHSSTTWPRLRRAKELGITVLGELNAGLVPQLRAAGPARLAGITLHDDTATQARTLPHGAATFTVRPHQYLPAGDHELVLFEVLDYRRDDHAAPLVYFDRRVDPLQHERKQA
jgi:flavin reductase (DIM6/NTAB) family NADH-FMN oxidoreductase RutF